MILRGTDHEDGVELDFDPLQSLRLRLGPQLGRKGVQKGLLMLLYTTFPILLNIFLAWPGSHLITHLYKRDNTQ